MATKTGITRYYGASKKKKMANMAIAILLLLGIFVVLVTIYGQNVGNFVVAVETRSQVNLALSETIGFENPSSRLAARGVRDLTNTTYIAIPKDIGAHEGGSHNDDVHRRYFAYTFYIKNMSPTVLNYDMVMTLNHVTNRADNALRIMVIKNNDERTIYARDPEGHRHANSLIAERDEDYDAEPFLSAVTMFQQVQLNFERNQINKYTIVMWLEGWDYHCTDAILGSIIRLELQFNGYVR